MSTILGIDTSNYTTSVAAYDLLTSKMTQNKKLLPVKEGTVGLRQSDAVFHHTKQLPEIIEELECIDNNIVAIGASSKPCSKDGSYMPCFLVGSGLARSFSKINHIPLHLFTHQQGHVAAALYGAERTDLLNTEFLAFHISGGTTDLLLVQPDEESIIRCECIAQSLDLKAGQLIDRVGNKLGLSFPAGPQLDAISLDGNASHFGRIKASTENGNCHFSGVENQCEKLIQEGYSNGDVALYCLLSIYEAIASMTKYALDEYGNLPVLFAGGVMSNTLLKSKLSNEFNGVFAPPIFSSDNAVGIAYLTMKKEST